MRFSFNKDYFLGYAKDVIKCAAWFIGGFMLSSFVFGDGFAWHFVLCAAMPLIWIKAPTRKKAFLIVFGYYLGAAREVPIGGAVFFGSATPVYGLAFLLWIVASLLLTAPWTIFWSDFKQYETGKNRFLQIFERLTAALFFVTVPPIGIFGWASPIMGYAWLPFMTGMGFVAIIIGIVFTAAIAEYLFILADREGKKTIYIVKMCIVLFFAMCFMFNSSPTKLDMNQMSNDLIHIRSIETHEGKIYSGSAGFDNDISQLKAFLKKYVNITKKDNIIVLPETVCGTLNSKKVEIIADYISRSVNNNVTVFVGAESAISKNRYENGLYCFCRSGIIGTKNYIQRFPVPISMWQPWSGSAYSCSADWFGKSVIKINNQRAACLICFEHVLAFPILASFAHIPFYTKNRPTMIIGVTNQWWSAHTNIPNIQDQSLLSWCRLFGVPAVTAENRGI